MWYTIFFVILWLMSGGGSLSIGTPTFWALIVAIIVDLVWNGWYSRIWQRRP